MSLAEVERSAEGDDADEILRMPDGSWVIANGKSFRLCGPEISSNPFLFQQLPETGNARHTRQLMAGALLAGLRCGRREQAPPVEARTLSLESYVYALAGAYQTTHATPPT